MMGISRENLKISSVSTLGDKDLMYSMSEGLKNRAMKSHTKHNKSRKKKENSEFCTFLEGMSKLHTT